VRRAVEATLAEERARFVWGWPIGDPVIETEDVQGTGVVDFARERVWMTYRSVSARDTASFRERGRLLGHLFAWQSRRFRARYFEGRRRWSRKRRGSWSERRPIPEPREPFCHPLWLLKPLSRLRTEPEGVARDEVVRGVATIRYSVSLTPAELPAAVWNSVAQPHAPGPKVRRRRWGAPLHYRARSAIPAFVWLDVDERVRRMSFETYAFHESPSSWATTELWDFGVPVETMPVPGHAKSDAQ
jgi:hypothetical protein